MGIVLDPTKCFAAHPGEEILEEYAFRRLPEALADQVEEHLLICHNCQDAVAETDRFVSALKVAARQPAPAVDPTRWGWRNALSALPRLAAYGASQTPAVLILAVLAIVTVRQHAPEPPAPVVVSLSSLRGPDPLSAAPAGKPLQLTIQTPDLARAPVPGKQYWIEVVDAGGSPVWKGAVAETGVKLVATMSKPLGSGVYWVRLYGADSELLREFGLSAK